MEQSLLKLNHLSKFYGRLKVVDPFQNSNTSSPMQSSCLAFLVFVCSWLSLLNAQHLRSVFSPYGRFLRALLMDSCVEGFLIWSHNSVLNK